MNVALSVVIEIRSKTKNDDLWSSADSSKADFLNHFDLAWCFDFLFVFDQATFAGYQWFSGHQRPDGFQKCLLLL